jgi:hypothetical protein
MSRVLFVGPEGCSGEAHPHLPIFASVRRSQTFELLTEKMDAGSAVVEAGRHFIPTRIISGDARAGFCGD